MDDAMVVTDLVKTYRPKTPAAVDGLSFQVNAGEIFGLLGPNGAGKTTTIGVMTTRVRPTSGRGVIHGVDVVKNATAARQLLAVVPQRNNLDRSLTVRQNLMFHAAYHRMPRAQRARRADELLEQMELTAHAKGRVDYLSGGMAQRVMIARALMHEPKVMFLDEPSAGLDPQARLFVHDKVAELRSAGVTIMLTTHDMDEAAKLCDRIGIIDHGKLLALDTPEALTRMLPGNTTLTLTVNLGSATADEIRTLLGDVPEVERVERVGPPAPPPELVAPDAEALVQFRVFTESKPVSAMPAVLKAMADGNHEVRDLTVGKPSLEDVFIHLTGRDLR
ncbi:ATP-binding cassette domain-containing protein [Dactylosporangium sp. CA-052675]|uniref:ABC transporter ATP-binding protein n=1 Tax=Dactylosporangium sp. CA-052675 TaxID=3239927 RepID=UPI003D8F5A72